MLNLILADAELELVPSEIADHPAIRKHSDKRKGKRPENMLLDSAAHGSAMRSLEEGNRRGRPDITHFFLLLAQDSIVNQRGELRVWIHTRNEEIIQISPKTRIHPHSTRFYGLIESLFLNGAVPDSQNPLMDIKEGTLSDLLNTLEGEKICLHPEGKEKRMQETFNEVKGDITIIIGGFAEGDFHSPVKFLVNDSISLGKDPLKVWTVASEVLSAYTPRTNTRST